MKTVIPVVFAVDNDYVKQLAATIVSILKNSDKENIFAFYILSSFISDENKDKLLALKKFNPNIQFKYIDMKQYISNLDIEKYMNRREYYTYISPETYYRFFIPELFSEYDKVLYLDADIVVFNDIKKLYETDISGVYAGVINDTCLEAYIESGDSCTNTPPRMTFEDYFKNKLKKKNKSYFNAGVLLLNLKKMREDSISCKLWEFVQKESPLEFQDQDVLNAVLEEKLIYVDSRWNILKDLPDFCKKYKYKNKRKHLKDYNNPYIFHFVGPNKPWVVVDNYYNYKYIKDWWKYYRMTPFYKKEDEAILRAVSSLRLQVLLSVEILDFTLLEIVKDRKFLRLTILNSLRTRIKLKDPLKNGIKVTI